MMSIARKGILYKVLLWISLIISIFLLLSLSPVMFEPENIIVDDFSQFWAAGRLNISSENPYSPEGIVQTIRNIGGKISNDEVVSIMLNPPWTLAIMMPFALMDYSISRLIWLLLNIALVIISAKYLWDIYNGEDKTRKMTYLFVFLFSPTIAALQKGQFTPIILFGIVLTMYTIKRRDEPWIAGIFLAFATLKPQLIYLLWIMLILWTYHSKRWQLLVSTVLSVLILSLIVFVVNPDVFAQYFYSMGLYPFYAWATPTIGSLFRIIFGLERFWLQFLPMLLGTIFFIAYWLRRKKTWNVVDDTPMIVAVSLFTTAYAWTYDAILFLIPIVQAIHSISLLENKRMKILLFSSILAISVLNLLLHTRLNDFWFFWLFPALFVWFLIAIESSRKVSSNQNTFLKNYAK